MIGLDTNILVRFVTKDDDIQARKAYEVLTQSCSEQNQGFVSTIVLIELVWVLQSCYEYEKAYIIQTLESLILAKEICLEHSDSVQKACNYFSLKNVDFSDTLIGIINKSYGCKTTVTFDKKAAKISEFTEVA